ncbi:MAG: methyltransferase domain-containing protein [Alphaproteobacteria bacterium]|nr:methyltransferase domain-containing protein [Alphaproteobacteria bacterium]MBF0250744.1 methyltransferase domain-containing protein [Alphaproteobacteria bacterium]
MTPSTHRTNSEVLTATLELEGRKVVDIGCGEGDLVRLMTRHGAKAYGIEPNPVQLEKAHAEKPAGGEVYYEGRAESLPFDDESVDVAVFFNSLHHIPAAVMDAALAEAKRALKPGGVMYVCEPVAEGPHFELMQPVHDETVVRAQAYAAVQKARDAGVADALEFTYLHPARHKDFAQFKERMLRINPHRAADFAALEADLRAAFDRLGRVDGDGFVFDQPMRVNMLTKA